MHADWPKAAGNPVFGRVVLLPELTSVESFETSASRTPLMCVCTVSVRCSFSSGNLNFSVSTKRSLLIKLLSFFDPTNVN